MLGALLLVFSVCALYLTVPSLLQYAFLPSAETSSPEGASDPKTSDQGASDPGASAPVNSASSDASALLKKYGELSDPALWAGEDIPMTLHGTLGGLTVSREGSTLTVSDVRGLLAGPRFGEVFPREMAAGSFLSPAELSSAAPSVVLDSALSFQLFGDLSPLGQKVQINESPFTVTGIAAHSRSLGSGQMYTLWVPLGSLPGTPELLTVSARPAGGGDSLSSLWRSKARELFGSGTFRHLGHEKTGAALLPRILLLFFALVLMKKWFSVLRSLGHSFRTDARERLSRSYASRLIGYFALRLLLALVLLGITLGACWGLAALAVEPLMAFPDWIPENPADFSSWGARFWSLVSSNAEPLSLVTEQAAVIRFWSFLIRLGTLLLLLGLLSAALRRGKKND